MSDVYQSIRLGGEDRNAESLGDFVAWLITNDMLDPVLAEQSGHEAARVKMQDLTGAAFLTTVLHGDLKPEHLNETGRNFCAHYLASDQYDRDYQQLEYEAENDWLRFDVVSAKISEVYRAFIKPEPALKKLAAKVIQFPSRK
tara:strand:+ start:5222 stop:5650 length:429 start_codon:yes stop_codon:yes gene_type:complete